MSDPLSQAQEESLKEVAEQIVDETWAPTMDDEELRGKYWLVQTEGEVPTHFDTFDEAASHAREQAESCPEVPFIVLEAICYYVVPKRKAQRVDFPPREG